MNRAIGGTKAVSQKHCTYSCGAMATFGETTATVYPIGNYNFGVKGPRHEKDKSVSERLLRMRSKSAPLPLDTLRYPLLTRHTL